MSTGKAITFVKDAIGRLTQMIEPDGTSLSYHYEGGNLVSVRNGAQGRRTATGMMRSTPAC